MRVSSGRDFFSTCFNKDMMWSLAASKKQVDEIVFQRLSSAVTTEIMRLALQMEVLEGLQFRGVKIHLACNMNVMSEAPREKIGKLRAAQCSTLITCKLDTGIH